MIVVDFVYERSTPNTHRFKEVPKPGKPQIVGTIYVKKDAFPEADEKTTLKVTLMFDKETKK